MIAYKGFSPGLVCRDYQFKMGLNVTDEANCARNGFHCAENPMDCLSYYPDMAHSEYCLVNAGGDVDEDDRDSKISCTELTILKRLDREEFFLHALAYMSAADQKTVQAYLGTEKSGYYGLLEYQEKLLDEALARRHKKVTDPWDADLSPTRSLPKDWDRWVDKVGIRENFIFYRYEKRGARQGYCTYCGKDVPIIGKPRYNKVSRCPCCRHRVTFKSIGKMGLFSTEWNCVYLLQPRPDGFVVREFWASRLYTTDNWKNPEIICSEMLRTIYDDQLNPRTYFWGDFKHRELRWIKGMPSSSWYSPQSNYYIHGNQPGRVYGKGLSRLLRTKLDGTGLKIHR